MAAYGTDPARYLPPHTSQLATKLSADGVDDCLVCSTLALVNGASLGEATRTPQGHEPPTAALVRTAVRNAIPAHARCRYPRSRRSLTGTAGDRWSHRWVWSGREGSRQLDPRSVPASIRARESDAGGLLVGQRVSESVVTSGKARGRAVKRFGCGYHYGDGQCDGQGASVDRWPDDGPQTISRPNDPFPRRRDARLSGLAIGTTAARRVTEAATQASASLLTVGPPPAAVRWPTRSSAKPPTPTALDRSADAG